MSPSRKASQFSIEQLEKLDEKLQSYPEVRSSPTKSKADAVQFLKGTIQKMQERGYSFDQIAEILSENGMSITTPTLKNYMYRAKQNDEGKPKRKSTGKRKDEKEAGEKPPMKVDKAKATFDIAPDTDEI